MKKRTKLKRGTGKNGKNGFGMLSVKAGVDKNPKSTQADRIAGATKRTKAMGGGMMKKRAKAMGGGMMKKRMKRGGKVK